MSEIVRQEEVQKKEQSQLEREPLRSGVTYTPQVDIVETDEELVLYADMPGVTHEHLDIRFENAELVIQGRVAARQQNVEFIYGEYGIGDFYRAFSIGEAIDAERIAAELKDGVLIVHLPKSEKVKPRRIEVKPG